MVKAWTRYVTEMAWARSVTEIEKECLRISPGSNQQVLVPVSVKLATMLVAKYSLSLDSATNN